HRAQQEEGQNGAVVRQQEGRAVQRDDEGAQAGNGHRHGEHRQHGEVLPQHHGGDGYRRRQQQLVCLGVALIRHGAHGENGDHHHENEERGAQREGEIGVSLKQVVGKEIDADEDRQNRHEDPADHGVEIGADLPLINRFHRRPP
ncbi:dUTP diphosphatase, partial [Dysosmobacter welbionis]